RDALKEVLIQAGYKAFATRTFEDGVRALATGSPDLVITDLRLGEYNGLHLLLTSPKPVPAIVLTGFADPVLEADARQIGADYLIKPVSPPVLLAAIEKKLEQARKGS